MLTVTKTAARQIRHSARLGDSEELALRIAAVRQPDGSIDYRIGFDDVGVDDVLVSSRGVDLVIAREHKALLSGTIVDYVELNPGEHRFIFMNPNDPTYRPPSEE